MFDLTSAHIHLAINHLPVVGALLATGTLMLAALTRQGSTRNLGFGLLVFAALSALPAYFSGEGAEEMVEDRAGVSEGLIEHHEDAAAQALAATLAAGVVAAAALLAVRLRHERAVRTLFVIALFSSLASTGLMGRVANLGGQIRHDEIRSASADTGRLSHPREARLHEDDD
jgi:hypothetical protein